MATKAQQLISSDLLASQTVFPESPTRLEIFETHISWVVLTGKYAYKIKKPVNLGFVDYSTLALRKACCEKELKLNRETSSGIYLDVIPISLQNSQLIFEDRSAPVEFAVKMKQFPQEAILAARLNNPELTADQVEDFAKRIAIYHANSPADTADIGRATRIGKDAIDNLTVLLDEFSDEHQISQLNAIYQWTVEEFSRIEDALRGRISDQKFRRCHGDLHLKNIIQWKGEINAFDCIEFNDEFQWIDVMSEIGFPVMDFMARGRTDLAWRFLNSYLEHSGDFEGLSVLKYYLVYRAMVRAKVTWLNPKNHGPGSQSRIGPWKKYIDLAAALSQETPSPTLAIAFGFSGSGKSTKVMQQIDQFGGMRIRSDVERKRFSEAGITSYSAESKQATYDRLLDLATMILRNGFSVYVDATFLSQHDRYVFMQLAEMLNVPYQIIACEAPFEELCRRIQRRTSDPSDATITVLRNQIMNHDPLTSEEKSYVVTDRT